MRLLISAGEASGDVLAAELVAALARHGALQARGVAGPAMRAAGVEVVARSEDIAVNGLWEVVSRLGAIRQVGRRLERQFGWADLFVVVDAPDFHLPLARRARARGVKVVGYVSPQVWAWRSGRVVHMARSLDRLLCLFPFEPRLYQPHGLDARFVGHPVVERLQGVTLSPRPDTFALLPGSRRHEWDRLLPVFLGVARRVRQRVPGARFLLGRASTLPAGLLEGVPLGEGVEVLDGLLPAVSHASAALVASGTATLELAVLGVPMVVAYRVHPSTYWVGRLVVKGVDHIALPNILAGGPVVPEYIQTLDEDVLAERLVAEARSGVQRQALAELTAKLGPSGSAQRAAAALLDLAPADWIQGEA